MIAICERGPGIADELISIQVRDDRGVELSVGDELTQIRETSREGIQQLPERLRLDFEFSDTGALSGDPQKFDVHDGPDGRDLHAGGAGVA